MAMSTPINDHDTTARDQWDATDHPMRELALVDRVAELESELARREADMATLSASHEADMATLSTSHEQRIEAITVSLHAAGDRHGWCRDYDRVLDDAGLRPRITEYLVTCEVILQVNVRVRSRDSEHARREVNRSLIEDHLADMDDYQIRGAINEWQSREASRYYEEEDEE